MVYQIRRGLSGRCKRPPKDLTRAFASFPRFMWIHALVTLIIGKTVNKVEEERSKGQRSSDRPQNKGRTPFDDKPIHKDRSQYKDDQQQHLTEIILPCHYLSSSRHPHVAKAARALSAGKDKRGTVEDCPKNLLEPCDLLADHSALQPPKRPLVWAQVYDWNSKETRVSQQRRMENVPHKVSSICSGAKNSRMQLHNPCRLSVHIAVAVTDGMSGNARSSACVARAGTEQAAALKKKARPCILERTVANTAKDLLYSFIFVICNYSESKADLLCLNLC
ncbi:hypothetical protein Q5P01_018104 [Channa striata]|uniref:Uncharacterized protein n=1 Tax=Channa striata TaxID=64152 RepID=A0AA88M786_CHASR|nr:hypothetical protein Q5P01_018104 [Channa striata]